MLSSRNIQYGHGRARSGTTGSTPEAQTAPALQESNVPSRPRPSQFRSRSYLSPVDLKPRNAITMPFESSPLGRNAEAADRARTEKDGGKTDDSGASTLSLLPKIHFPGHGHRKRESQDVSRRSVASTIDGSHTQQQSQLSLQHLGLNLPVPVKRSHSHRHTKSEVPHGKHAQESDSMASDGLLHPGMAAAKGHNMLTRMTSNLSGRNIVDGKLQHMKSHHHQHSTSDFHKAWNSAVPSDHAVNTSARPHTRRRATSDPRSQPYQSTMPFQAQYGALAYMDRLPRTYQQMEQKPFSEVEVLLHKAEKARKEAELNVSEADVQKLAIQLAESNVELQEQFGTTNRSVHGLMRRLDDVHDNMINTNSSLIDTISSFRNLCTQSDALITTFEHKTGELDREMKAALEKHKRSLFEKRGSRIGKLEKRSRKAGDRAEEMSQRLENCRTIVRNFAEREQTKRKAWKGVLVGSIWGCAVILLGVVLGLSLWWYKSHGTIAKYDVHEAIALVLDSKGLGGFSGCLHDTIRDKLQASNVMQEAERARVVNNVPDDVRAVLDDIAHRHNASTTLCVSKAAAKSQQHVKPIAEGELENDKRLKKLFDELEL